MRKAIVRLQEIEINNFKNVEKGSVAFQSYSNIKKNTNERITDILGVYGQNGSGKTALVDAVGVLKKIISGESLDENIRNLISVDRQGAILKFVFLIEREEDKFLVNYEFEIRKTDKDINISKEKLSYSILTEGNKKQKTTIIDYDVENTMELFKPSYRYKEVIESNSENVISLNVSKAMTKKERRSFVFSEENEEIFKNGFKSTADYVNIMKALKYFARFNLFVIQNDHLGFISMNQLIPISFRLENSKDVISGDFGISLFGSSSVQNDVYDLLKKVKVQINTVVSTIIPGLNIDIVDYGQHLLEDGKMVRKIELVSIRDGKRIPLRYESEGIKKIISILSALIAMYNNKAICLVVDELDAGVFEYLLGEILSILEENAKGQFIFTSHNLRALEKLNKESIIFTTTNPKNRYIKFTNIKNNNNLRDVYLRGISLGGQKENIYEETNSYEISYAFKRAGRVLNEN